MLYGWTPAIVIELTISQVFIYLREGDDEESRYVAKVKRLDEAFRIAEEIRKRKGSE